MDQWSLATYPANQESTNTAHYLSQIRLSMWHSKDAADALSIFVQAVLVVHAIP